MKTLVVMRHAKSSWKAADLPDHERPLNGRGRRDAPRMGRWIARHATLPDRIVSSTAIRAQTTARLAAAEFGDAEPETELRSDLYLGGPEAYVGVLRETGAGRDVAMVVGHNPDVEELVLLLTGRPVSMPTAAVAVLELPIERWSDLDGEIPGTLAAHGIPREIDEP